MRQLLCLIGLIVIVVGWVQSDNYMENPPMKEQEFCYDQEFWDDLHDPISNPIPQCHLKMAEDESLRPWYVKIFNDYTLLVWIAIGILLIGLFAPQKNVNAFIEGINGWLERWLSVKK